MNIEQVGDAIHQDFFSVSGSDIPPDATLEFTTAIGDIPVNADFIRPHLVLVESLKSFIPLGNATLRLRSLSTASTSNDVAVTVSAGPPQNVRLLHAGAAKPRPYTIAFVANPLLASATDPILSNRAGYQRAVVRCLKGLFDVEEDVLRSGDIDARMRLVSVFPSAGTTILPLIVKQMDLWKIRDVRLAPFLSRFLIGADAVQADIVVIIHGSTEAVPSAARPTTDDPDPHLGGVPYTFQVNSNVSTRRHGFFPRFPGSFVVGVNINVNQPTILHEFCHAASEVENGWVTDLYNGERSLTDKFLVNIRYRVNPTDAIPELFAIYNGMTFRSSPVRVEGTPYPPNWRGFYPEPLPGAPQPHRNLMDDFSNDEPPPLLCRLDRLTHTWLSDRLNVKLSR